MTNPSDHVFVNCPFDEGFKPIFDVIVFAITDLGFVARSAREEDDGGEFRLAKIQRIIEQCRYGVHDISSVKLGRALAGKELSNSEGHPLAG